MNAVNKFASVSDTPGMCWYRQLAPEHLPRDVVVVAEHVFSVLCPELDIDRLSIQVVWVAYEDSRVAAAQSDSTPVYDGEPFSGSPVVLLPCTFGGLVPGLSKSVVILNAAVPERAHLVHAAIEELFHVHQHRTWPAGELKDAVHCEQTAKDYVALTMPRILQQIGNDSQ
jgi:hypothetical protein